MSRETSRMRAADRYAARMNTQHRLARTQNLVIARTPIGQDDYTTRRALARIVPVMTWNNQKKWFEAPISDAPAIYESLRRAWPNIHVSPGVKEILR